MFKRVPDAAPATLGVTVDGTPVAAFVGETVASVLTRLSPYCARNNPVNGQDRAPYCMMGVCFECLVRVDGSAAVQSCLIPVEDGMRIERLTQSDQP
ncbi:(2Fe-2S)-binding protein [Paracoccus aminovorans]|uniref:(2Fe-2S)-binding protein n=1 Tax=Paracoccus aminovorans TaxID=34004 RepID=UPI0007864662|nr:(2Fe-2S)-binding protein [Paracoccus aminovorans]